MSLCGQCITHCPAGALRERDDTARSVWAAHWQLRSRVAVVQIAPAVRAAWGEAIGMPTRQDATVGKHRCGACAAHGSGLCVRYHLLRRPHHHGGRQRSSSSGLQMPETSSDRPMFTSCCPGWAAFSQNPVPGNGAARLSTAKSPQQMFGAVAKSWLAHRLGIEPENVYSISIMPCIAKKAERELPGMQSAGAGSDVDLVLTTRELARIVRAEHIDVEQLADSPFDDPLGNGSGAGVIFGATGGVHGGRTPLRILPHHR